MWTVFRIYTAHVQHLGFDSFYTTEKLPFGSTL